MKKRSCIVLKKFKLYLIKINLWNAHYFSFFLFFLAQQLQDKALESHLEIR